MTRCSYPSALGIRGTWLAALLFAACGGSAGGDTSDSSAGTDGDPMPDPQIFGDQCGDVTNLGFEIECLVDNLEFNGNAPLILSSLSGCSSPCDFPLRTLFENARPCCEGSAPAMTANNECTEACTSAACKQAEDLHDALIGESCMPLTGNSGFDRAGCLTGDLTSHTFDCNVGCVLIGQAPCGETYDLEVDCAASSNEYHNPDGTFGFLGDNNPTNDPDSCAGSTSLVFDPEKFAIRDSVQESLGSKAGVVWTIGDEQGKVSTTDLEIDASYDLVACPGGTCLQLSQLVVETSSFSVEGITVGTPRLSLVGVDVLPLVSGNGNFSFPPGTLEVIVEYAVFGTRQHLSGTNAESTIGRIIPGSNIFSISNLEFVYTDPGIAASLHVDVVGDYTKRAPIASFVPVSEPTSCSQPVIFDATSKDADGDPITHTWEVDGQQVTSGPSLTVHLQSGEHTIALLAQDDDGRADAAVLGYARQCW